jgi:trehalose-phosphatase
MSVRMLHPLESWGRIGPRLRAAKAVALFLDFDGTLVRLEERPTDVRLAAATRRALARLARVPRLGVFVISGRRRRDLRERIGVSGLDYLGLHGWENGQNPGLGAQTRSLIGDAMKELAGRLNGTPGLWIEDKGSAFALHYRGAADDAIHRGRVSLIRTLEPLSGRLRMLEGDHIWEVLPGEIPGKGAAARRVWRMIRPAALPIYVGNDSTDEPAYRALAGGITVQVGHPRPSHAHFRLRHPGEVRRFLEKIEEELR